MLKTNLSKCRQGSESVNLALSICHAVICGCWHVVAAHVAVVVIVVVAAGSKLW